MLIFLCTVVQDDDSPNPPFLVAARDVNHAFELAAAELKPPSDPPSDH